MKGEKTTDSACGRDMLGYGEKSIPVEKRDAMLSERLKEEYAGIFAWMVKGLVDLKKSRWKLPDYQSGNIDNILDRINGDVNTNDEKKVSGSVAEWLLRKTCHTFQYVIE